MLSQITQHACFFTSRKLKTKLRKKYLYNLVTTQHIAYLQVRTPWSGKDFFYPENCKTFSLPRLHLLQPKYLFLLGYGPPKFFFNTVSKELFNYFNTKCHAIFLILKYIFMIFIQIRYSSYFFSLLFYIVFTRPYKVLGKHTAKNHRN